MDKATQELLEKVEQAQQQMSETLALTGLSEEDLPAVIETLRGRLAEAELRRVEDAKSELLQPKRARTGSSALQAFVGIRG